MKRNYNFSDHRDAVRAPSSAAGSVPESPEDVLKSVLPAVRKDFFLVPTEDAARPDLSRLDQEDTENDISRPPATPANASSTTSTPVASTGAGPEKSIFVVQCEMIRPMRVIKGNLEITSIALKFRETSENDKSYAPGEFFPLPTI